MVINVEHSWVSIKNMIYSVCYFRVPYFSTSIVFEHLQTGEPICIHKHSMSEIPSVHHTSGRICYYIFYTWY